LIEPAVFRLAAGNASEMQLRALGEILEETAVTKELERHVELGLGFHRLVAKACGNMFYTLLMDTIMDFMSSFLRHVESDELRVFLSLFDQ
jgi:DNA-binding FadR family transcriptional regulator